MAYNLALISILQFRRFAAFNLSTVPQCHMLAYSDYAHHCKKTYFPAKPKQFTRRSKRPEAAVMKPSGGSWIFCHFFVVLMMHNKLGRNSFEEKSWKLFKGRKIDSKVTYFYRELNQSKVY